MLRSRANGPGWRAVLWLQGCSLGCAGCYNPSTHDLQAGQVVSAADVFAWIKDGKNDIEGLTVSGGEPFLQPGPLAVLLRRVRIETTLSILVFSGFSLQEIEQIPAAREALVDIDVLIAGRYDQARRRVQGLRGSANKIVHLLSERYSLAELEAVPPAEIIVTPQGELLSSGIDPVRW